MAGGDGMALVLVSHDGVDRREVMDVLRRRWPDFALKELEQETPTVAMTAEDAADLGRCRRGIEPLRIVVMPQHDRQPITSTVLDPVPDRADHPGQGSPSGVAAPIQPVHKSPSLTAAKSWLPTAISTAKFAVPRTMCFQVHPPTWRGEWDWRDRLE